MKMNKLFTFGLAALAFAACSNEENGPAGENGQKGEIVDEISVRFTDGGHVGARAGETMDGKGTENAVYVAYVFAHEMTGENTGAVTDKWSVRRVMADPTADAGKKDADITTAIPPLAKDVTTAGNPSQEALATFSNVRLGDNVYVIVNDPEMSLETAQGLATNATDPEKAIQAYSSTVKKSYLGALTKKTTDTELPKGRFTMAGKGTIPTTPAVASGTNVVVPVLLDRELAKVVYSSAISGAADDEATGQLVYKEGDGFIVVRIPRSTSFFSAKEPGFYFPAAPAAADLNWGADWANPFDGQTNSSKDVVATAPAVGFNLTNPADAAKEYRMTWDIKASTVTDGYVTVDAGTVKSPYFYVTPNYANTQDCTTAIVAQVTYIGAPGFADANAQTVFTSCYDLYATTKIFREGGDDNGDVIDYRKLTWTDAHLAAAQTYLADATNKNAIETASGLVGQQATDALALIAKATKVTEAGTGDVLSYYQGMKRYYSADVAEYTTAGGKSTSNKITERNTFYNMKTTITSFGAASISDAIKSDNIGMIVTVSVNKWVFKNVNIKL